MGILSGISSNSLFVQQTRQRKMLTGRVVAVGSLRITMVIVFVTIIACIWREEIAPLQILLLLFAIVFVAAIPFVAYATAFSTVKEVKDQAYELVLLTTLDGARISAGLLLRAMYRIRLLMSLLFMGTPVVIIAATVAQVYNCASSSRYCINSYYNDLVVEIGLPLAIYVLVFAIGWGVLLLNAAVGLTMGLWWRNSTIAGLGSVFLSFVIGLTSVIIFNPLYFRDPFLALLQVILATLLLYGAVVLMMQVSRLFVRR